MSVQKESVEIEVTFPADYKCVGSAHFGPPKIKNINKKHEIYKVHFNAPNFCLLLEISKLTQLIASFSP